MTETALAGTAELSEHELMRKVSRRLLWFLCALFMATYIDRINIAFAALSMNEALGLTATMFGIANSLLYAGYVVFEIPSNLLMVRYGARVWLSRIMITIGITSAATIFAVGPLSLYVLRLLVGIAEAGFVPGYALLDLLVPSVVPRACKRADDDRHACDCHGGVAAIRDDARYGRSTRRRGLAVALLVASDAVLDPRHPRLLLPD